jgi:hypothetical protein
MGVTVDVDTGMRTGPDDSGIRRIYADTARAKTALREAIVAAGAIKEGLQPGGRLWMQWTGEDPATAIPAKTWLAMYWPPAAAAAHAVLATAPPVARMPQQAYAAPVPYVPPAAAAAHAVPAPPPAPAYVPPAPPAPPARGRPIISAVQAAAMANAGIDISQFDVVG